VSRIVTSIGLLALVGSACSRDVPTPPTDGHPLSADGRSLRSVRSAVVPVPAAQTAEERFASLLPEFAGAYRGA
jgi:hypothetical protein